MNQQETSSTPLKQMDWKNAIAETQLQHDQLYCCLESHLPPDLSLVAVQELASRMSQ
jgi:hypothetical protein